MVSKTKIASDIEKSEAEIRYDSGCKAILSNKKILAYILQEFVSEFKGIDVDEIAEKYIENNLKTTVSLDSGESSIIGLDVEDLDDGKVIYDILFTAKVPQSSKSIGVIINVEAQNDSNPGYPLLSRAIYYCSRLISRQKNSAIGFRGKNYGDLKKVYSIWICLKPNKKQQNTVNVFELTEKQLYGNYKYRQSDYDLLSVVMINLSPEYNSLRDLGDSIRELLSLIFNPEVKSSDKLQGIEKYGIKELNKEVEDMCNFSKGVLQQGLELGKIDTYVSNIKSLMQNVSCSFEEACKMLNIDTNLQAELANRINTGKTAE